MVRGHAKVPILMVLALVLDCSTAAVLGPASAVGSLSLELTGYGSSGVVARRVPFSWSVTGDPALAVYGISLPFSFVLSEQERSIRQPFNQFGLSPSWRWATLHLGYRNLTWSPYTLAGRTFLGGGMELNPGLLRLGAAYGRLQRAVKEDTVAVHPDSVEQTPAYRRAGYAVRLGVGRPANYFDLIFLRAADDSASLPGRPTRTVLMPAENAVLGVSSRQQVGRLLDFYLDLAASLYTRDQAAAPILTDIPVLKTLSRISQPRASSQYFLAGRGGANLTLGKFSAGLQYERVEPEYPSMGANDLATDLSRLTVSPRLDLLANRLMLSGSAGTQSDNLLHTKRATTSRLIWSAQAGIYPSQTLGLDLQYSNYATGQKPGTAPVNDTTRLDQVNQSLTVSPRLTWVGAGASHNLFLTLNYTGLSDANSITRSQNNSAATVLALGYGLGTAGFSLSGAGTFSNSTAGETRNSVTGFSLTATKPLLNQRLSIYLTPAVSWLSLNRVAAATTLTAQAGADLRLGSHHTFRAGLSFLSNQAQASGQTSFSELSASTGYGFGF